MQHAYSNEISYLQFHIATWYHPSGGETEAGSVDESTETSVMLSLNLLERQVLRLTWDSFVIAGTPYFIQCSGIPQSKAAQRPVCCASCRCIVSYIRRNTLVANEPFRTNQTLLLWVCISFVAENTHGG